MINYLLNYIRKKLFQRTHHLTSPKHFAEGDQKTVLKEDAVNGFLLSSIKFLIFYTRSLYSSKCYVH